MTATNSQTVTEIRNFFQKVYTSELTDLLRQKAEDGELESILDGDTIEGYILSGIDEAANTRTKDEFGWSEDNADVAEALEQPECYEGIDFLKIVSDARRIGKAPAHSLDIDTAVNIQSEVSDRCGAGYDDMEPIAEKYAEQGFDREEIDQTIADALAELAKVYGN